MVKVTYKGETRNIPDNYLKGLKGYERTKQIKSIFEGKARPKTKAPTKESSYTIQFNKKYGEQQHQKKSLILLSTKKWLIII